MNCLVKHTIIASLLLLAFLAENYSAQSAEVSAKPDLSDKSAATPASNEGEIAAREAAERDLAIKRLTDRLNNLDQKRHILRDELANIIKMIHGRCEVSPENVMPTMLNLEREIMSLKVELDVKQVTQESLSQEAHKAAVSAEKDANSDAVVQSLGTLIEIRRKAFDILAEQYKSGQAPLSDMNKAEAELAEAKIRLETRKEELSKGDIAGLSKLNQLMRENTLSLIQMRARYEALNSEYKKLFDSRELVTRYNEITDRLPRIDRQFDKIEDEIFYLENNLDRTIQMQPIPAR